jgi:hypothetical protein
MKVFRDLFRRMGIIALWYVGLFAAVMFALQAVFKVRIMGVDVGVSFLVISDISTRLYMLVIGIVFPLVYFNHYISVGVTRKRFFVGIIAAGTALSLCFTILRVPLLILDGEFSLPAVLVCVLYGTLAFLVGWTASVGFQHMRFIPIVVGTALAPLMYAGLLSLEKLQLPPLAYLWIFTGAILLVGLGLLLAVWRIPVKC